MIWKILTVYLTVLVMFGVVWKQRYETCRASFAALDHERIAREGKTDAEFYRLNPQHFGAYVQHH